MSQNTQKTGLTVDETFALDHAFSGDLSAFVALDTKARNRVRRHVQAEIARSITVGDLEYGRSVLTVQSALSGVSKKSEKSDVPAEVQIGRRVQTLLKAAEALISGRLAPNGMDPVELDIQLEWSISDDLDLGDISDESVEKVATQAIVRKSKENDIPTLIRTTFADVPIGTFMKVSDIRKKLGQGPEWDGRLSAALFGTNGVEGVYGVDKTSPEYATYNRKGGIKVESDIWDNLDNADDTDSSDESDES